MAEEICIQSNGNNYNVNYGLSLTQGNQNEIIISNFGGFGSNLDFTATLNGFEITLPLTSPLNNGETVQGVGTISQDFQTINFEYTFAGTGFLDTCTGTWTKL